MNIGITEDNRKAISDKLQQLLADEFVLHTKTRNYHWNLVAANFTELHSFYEKQYDELADIVDEVAERIRMYGFISNGRLSDFQKLTQLPEQDYTTDAREQLSNLINDHEAIIRYLRECIEEFEDKHGDAGAADFVTGLAEQHLKMSWMLRSHVE